MKVKQFINGTFYSNTYLISSDDSSWVWLIDVGEIDGILASLSCHSKIKGVFITHPHFDHIQGINRLHDAFPDCEVFTSIHTRSGLYSEKINLSFYHENPIVFNGSDVTILKDSDRIELFKDVQLEAIESPGHFEGCLSFKVQDYLFTGDSFIPGVRVVTKLRGGNIEDNKKSLRKLKSIASNGIVICPGHEAMLTTSAANLEDIFPDS